MKYRLCAILSALACGMISSGSAVALNTNEIPNISEQELLYYLTNIKDAQGSAGGYKFDIHDDQGFVMDSPSIIQLTNQPYKYAAVYHTGCQPDLSQTDASICNRPTSSDIRYKLFVAGSNDLLNWKRIKLLADNADMPRIGRVSNSTWLVVAHEQWEGAEAKSASPSKVSYRLYYTEEDLLNGQSRSVWKSPIFQKNTFNLNGTPSIYDMNLSLYNGYLGVNGQFGFHYYDGSYDRNAVTTIERLFNPAAQARNFPSVATAYNQLFEARGVKGNLGQRDTLVTTNARYNIQEGNVLSDINDFGGWRVWLYKFGDGYNYPTGNGTVTKIEPQTPQGSTSFGNPSVTIVDRPSGTGKAIVVSYMIFSEGAKPGEAGPVIYYFNI